MPLVHTEEITALPGLSGPAVLHVRDGARAAELVASDFHPFAAVRVQSGGSDLGQGHVQLRQLQAPRHPRAGVVTGLSFLEKLSAAR
jgi:hypothetical protein